MYWPHSARRASQISPSVASARTASSIDSIMFSSVRDTSTVEDPLEILRVSHEVEREQNRVLGARRAERDEAAARAAVARMAEVARTEDNMVPAMLDAVRAEATLGEICDALRAEWGDYREPPRF